MKGIIRGIEIVDYVKKDTGEPVKGFTVYLNVSSNDVIGMANRDEFIKFGTPYYNEIKAYMNNNIDDLIDSSVIIDYDVKTRGKFTIKDIIGFDIIPKKETIS